MAIRVTTNQHTVTMPAELTDRLHKLQLAGAFAKRLGEANLYNQLKDAFYSIKRQWESSAGEMCEKKSKTNWLGGGDVYRYISFCGDFEDFGSEASAEAIESRFGKQGLVDSLNKYIRELSNR